MELKVQLSDCLKKKPDDETNLGFGKIFTDHMFTMDYCGEKGWHNAKIIPFGEISLSPSATCLHYGQEVFEGMKAYRTKSGDIRLFRPEENFKRLNISCNRMCIPLFDEEFLLKSLVKLIKIDSDWVPHTEGASLYIRPFIIGTENSLGAHASNTYKFIIIMSPSGSYYASGINPIKIYVETNYVRAVVGGTGFAKTGGNYAGSFKAQDNASAEGYSQVLWLDAKEHKYIEEVGAMNVFFIIDNEVITPSLQGSILDGITRKSCIDILTSWGLKVSQRQLSIDEIVTANEKGTLKEAFGTGTAAVISPIGQLKYKDYIININNGNIGEISQKLYDTLTGIQFGTIKDSFDWIYTVK